MPAVPPPKSYFYGGTLRGEGASLNWKREEFFCKKIGNSLYSTKLHIKQILLGHDAKAGERNVVEVKTHNKKSGRDVQIPVAVLQLAETQLCLPDLDFGHGSVTFELTKGSGPVHIAGLQYPVDVDWRDKMALAGPEEELEFDEEQEDELDDEEEDDENESDGEDEEPTKTKK